MEDDFRPERLRSLVTSTCAQKPKGPARGGPTLRGNFALRRFLLRTSRPKLHAVVRSRKRQRARFSADPAV